jgi:hypothetical protein
MKRWDCAWVVELHPGDDLEDVLGCSPETPGRAPRPARYQESALGRVPRQSTATLARCFAVHQHQPSTVVHLCN